MLPGLLSFAKLDIVGGRVRKADGGKLMFNQDSGAQGPLKWPGRRSVKGLAGAFPTRHPQ